VFPVFSEIVLFCHLRPCATLISMSSPVETLLQRAMQARRENRPADARRDLVEAVSLCRRDEATLLLGMALTALGQIGRDLGNPAEAIRHYEEAVGIYRTAQEGLKLAHVVRHLADIHQDDGRLAQAGSLYEEALAIYRAHPETPPLDLANAIRGYALLLGTKGENQTAIALWQEAGSLYAAVNVEAGAAESARQIMALGGKARLLAREESPES
jgi:tetratricopeptide (TPR) repeat protein